MEIRLIITSAGTYMYIVYTCTKAARSLGGTKVNAGTCIYMYMYIHCTCTKESGWNKG